MNPKISCVAILAVSLLMSRPVWADDTFYVNPEKGADANPGTKDKPFKTVLSDADYAEVRALGDEFRARNPRSVER